MRAGDQDAEATLGDPGLVRTAAPAAGDHGCLDELLRRLPGTPLMSNTVIGILRLTNHVAWLTVGTQAHETGMPKVVMPSRVRLGSTYR
jgi:hypothetical protein